MAKLEHNIAAGILEMLKGEADARMDYEKFLALSPGLESEDVVKIQEIQSDEANHMLILQAMVKKYDGGISASVDGASKAISEITVGIGAEKQRGGSNERRN